MPKTWICPYWLWEKGLQMHCEGGRLDFPDAETRSAYIERYCAALPGWQDCQIAKYITKFYAGGKHEKHSAK